MYQHILVPLDGSQIAEQALPYATALARSLGASVDLVRVVVGSPPVLVAHNHRPDGEYAPGLMSREAGRHLAQGYLEAIQKSLEESGVRTSAAIRTGNAAAQIIQASVEKAGTLVAMSTHGRSGVSRWLLGSTTNKVLHSATFPLLVVRPLPNVGRSTGVQMSNVIVPLDGSPMAEHVLPPVLSLAKALNLKITLVRATPSPTDYLRYMRAEPLDSVSTVYYGPFEEFSKEVAAQAMDYIHKVANRLRVRGGPVVEERLGQGSPRDVIIDTAQEFPNSFIAMTTHGRSGLGRWVLGSVTDGVVRQCGTPVLVIRSTEEAEAVISQASTTPTSAAR